MNFAYIPNIMTVCRCLLVFPIVLFLLSGNYRLAFSLFLVAGISDALDGLLARQFNWMSRLGSILDPLADKLLLVSAFIVLAVIGALPVWLTVLVVCRDIWLVGGCVIYHYWIGRFDMAPTLLSKSNTFFQLALVAAQLFYLAFGLLPAWVTLWLIVIVTFTSVGSFIQYTWIGSSRAMRARRQG